MDNFLNQSTYEQLKKDILMFNLKPGDTVSAAKVADRYNVSRTPAREALVKLEAEGLVYIIPQSKSIISKIDLDKAKQEWFIRRTLELGMVDQLFDNLSDEVIKRMEYYNNLMISYIAGERNHENSYLYHLADDEFHAVTYRASKEYVAENVIRNNRAHYTRLRFLTDMDSLYQNRTVNGHEELISLLKAKDKTGYKEKLSIHLGHIMNDVREVEKLFPNYFI